MDTRLIVATCITLFMILVELSYGGVYSNDGIAQVGVPSPSGPTLPPTTAPPGSPLQTLQNLIPPISSPPSGPTLPPTTAPPGSPLQTLQNLIPPISSSPQQTGANSQGSQISVDADTKSPPFFKKWGTSCLLSKNTGCTDPDGETKPLDVGDGQFWGINSIDSDSNSVYVTDLLNHRIEKFDANGNFLTKWGSYCEIVTNEGKVLESSEECTDPVGPTELGDGQFNKPAGIAVFNNTVFVTDFNNRTQVFDTKGSYVAKMGSTGSSDGRFRDPHGIAVDNSGNIYVADTGNHRIQKFDKDGKFIIKWGSLCEVVNKYENQTYGSGCQDPDGLGPLEKGDGQFNSPTELALDEKNNLYVADTGNHRIEKFDTEGKFVTQWGSECEVGKQQCVMIWDNITGGLTSPGQFYYPIGLQTQDSKIIYVTDSGNNRVQVFDVNGTELITKWGSQCELANNKTVGTGCLDTDGPSGPLEVGDGQFNRPSDISQYGDHIFVADSANDRIQVFSVPKVVTVPPVANAGPDIPAQPGMLVYLDGQSGSRDPDGEIVSYSWKQLPFLNSSLVSLTGSTQPVAAFVAPQVTGLGGVYSFELSVTDNNNATSKDTAYVTISNMQQPNAFPQTNMMTPINNFNTSQPLGSTLPPGSQQGGVGNGGDGGDSDGGDGGDGGDKNQNKNQTKGGNLAPVADASAEPDSASSGEPVYLDASGSHDDDGSIEDYKWDIVGSGNGIEIQNEEARLTHFVVPNDAESGSVGFKLTVTDDKRAQTSDIIDVDITAAPPPEPTPGTGTPPGQPEPTPGDTGTPSDQPGDTGTPSDQPGDTGTPSDQPGDTGTPQQP